MAVLNKAKHWNLGADDVYIGRPSKFGNPFVIGRDGTRADVIDSFERWVRSQPQLIEAAKRELKGKNLVCWCAPLACHGDVLQRIANEP
jgi:hypothetical protein